MMRCVVTGGAGFIGSHLTELLLARGHDVLVVDNLATGRRANLGQLAGCERLELQLVDVRDRVRLGRAFRGAEWVFHLAGLADIVPSIEQPLEYFETNVRGTANALECARGVGAKRFVYAASSSCYGIPDHFPTPETAQLRPEYPYALTKYQGEQLVLHWARVYGLPALSLRLFNVFGPRSRTGGTYGAVFGVFLAQKVAGKPFTVVGDGTQQRDFTFVTDVARAFLAAAESDRSGTALNVGTGQPRSINELVQLLNGPVVHVPHRPGEPAITQADTTRINSELGWQAEVPFEDGVRQMLKQLGDWGTAPVWDPASIADATRTWFAHLGAAVDVERAAEQRRAPEARETQDTAA